ncbi:MAG TPA: hypothetical protein VFT64_01265 [Rickettsiales bacterium]|nr:hypothetical protein [Rickettsiales bacterium]
MPYCLRAMLLACLFLCMVVTIPCTGSATGAITFTGNGADQTKEISALLSKDGTYYFRGTVRTQGITLSGRTLTINFAPGSVWEPAGYADALLSCHNCNFNFIHLNIDGKGIVQQAVHMDGGTLNFNTITVDHIGSRTRMPNNIVAGLMLNGVTSIHGNNFTAAHLNALGDHTIGDNIGAARGIMMINSGPYQLGNVLVDWTGSDAEEADSFQVNINNAGGTVNNLKVVYNGNTRRCAKYQSGTNVLSNVVVTKAADFTPVSAKTDVGKKNFNCISWEGNTTGSLDVLGGYIDASGFVKGIGNNTAGSTATVRVHPGVTLIGSTKPVARTNTQTGLWENTDTYGFYTGLGESGSGIEGAKVIHFTVGSSIRCNNGYSRNVTYDDPVARGLDVFNSARAINAPDVSNNTIITRTKGYLSSWTVINVGAVTNGKFNSNKLVESGNHSLAFSLINFTNQIASATAYGNQAPKPMGGVVSPSGSNVRTQ